LRPSTPTAPLGPCRLHEIAVSEFRQSSKLSTTRRLPLLVV
jgi:hypothetical protein